MKITKIECIPCSLPFKVVHVLRGGAIPASHSVLVKIHTDEGITGIGDTGATILWYQGETQDGIMGLINGFFGPQILLGEDPSRIEKIMAAMDKAVKGNNQAKAVIDFALHDIVGKKLGVPVYQLLGGLTREKIPVGAVMNSQTPKEMVVEGKKYLAAGYHTLRFKVAFLTPEEDVENLKQLREAVGSGVEISVDANGGWHYGEALATMRKMQKYDLSYVEQPLPWWDIDGMARLRRNVDIPIVADESAWELNNLLQIIKKDAADGFLLKLPKAGGLLKARKWVSIAEAGGLMVMGGCMIGGGLDAAVHLHFSTAVEWMSKHADENAAFAYLIHGVLDTVTEPVKDDMVKVLPRVEKGFVYPLHGPGLGVELNEEILPKLLTKGKSPTVIGK